jgi:GrpB-like predicted nucleotidyltransferase (UPF0157 family)
MAVRGTSLGLAEGTLTLAVHDESWADEFGNEADRIRAALPGLALTIEHIGSTAVAELPAKPILDLAISIGGDDEAQVAAELLRLDYTDYGIRSGRLFVRRDASGARTHNAHLYLHGDPLLREQLAFRDVLRANPVLRADYAALKHELVARLGDAGRDQYANAKSDFIRKAIGRS